MKTFIVIIFSLSLLFIGCPDITNSNNTGSADPVDSAFWFGEIYETLTASLVVGGTLSGGYSVTDLSGVEASTQIVNKQYVCDTIKAGWGLSTFSPEPGTDEQAADCAYLLQMVDKANTNRTTFGASSYATNQVVDVTAVDDAVKTLQVPGGMFVAIGYDTSGNNAIASSSDGINWSPTTSPLTGTWTSIYYGNSKYVAVSPNSNTASSTDGLTWSINNAAPNNLHSVCYGDNGYVAMRENNTAIRSTDGTNWPIPAPPPPPSILTGTWMGVCYGNGKYVAVGYSYDHGNNDSYNYNIVYSADGENWTRVRIPGDWSDVCYGNGKYVAVSSKSTTAYSTNGENWTKAALPGDWKSVCYGNGRYVAVSFDGNATACSTDGINWSIVTMLSGKWNNVWYGNGKYVAVGFSISKSDNIAYSTDGINWSIVTLPGIWNNVTYGGY